MSLRAFAQGFAQTATPGIQMAFQRIGERRDTKRKEERQERLLGEQREYQKGVRDEDREYQESLRIASNEREDFIRSDNNIRNEFQTARTPEAVEKIWGTLTPEQQKSLGTTYEFAKGNSVRLQGTDNRAAELQQQQLAQGMAEGEQRNAIKSAREELYTGTGPIKSSRAREIAINELGRAKSVGDIDAANRIAGRLGLGNETRVYFKRLEDIKKTQLILESPDDFTPGVVLKHAMQAESGSGAPALVAMVKSRGPISDRNHRESILARVLDQEYMARAEAQKYGETRTPLTPEQLMQQVNDHHKTFKTLQLDGDVEDAINSAWANELSKYNNDQSSIVGRNVVAATIAIVRERGRVKVTPPVAAMIEKKVLEMMQPSKDETTASEPKTEEKGFLDRTAADNRSAAWDSAGKLTTDFARVAGVQGQALRNMLLGPPSKQSSGLRKAIDGDGSTYQDPLMVRALQ